MRRGGDLSWASPRLQLGHPRPAQEPHHVDTSRLQLLYQSLVQLDAQAQVEYVLAESITPHQGSLSAWVIRLRPA